ncbi:hypothetical protein JO972_08710 [Verrucomicrobiaceae bacterium 5K15]|uniref:Sialate O-acetylesterase domain-containing protein n=1 Tax=Oceaniferula flava TaxID=2800421 RepID=A0AAE2SCU2_9BACT|nr:sialate O-acetylesterase [Oceaniferula flavus]MBK1855037.1 hypothetical protein [Oceaniferula flavus]MBM1136343.1 hypothetical protein [Oceaniferula flavus]
MKHICTFTTFILILATCMADIEARPLKLHSIFTNHMVLQRDKPIMIWGWADKGANVSVKFGKETANATAIGEAGRWEVTFPARGADAIGKELTVAHGSTLIEVRDIVIGDVWVMNGQSNMAFGLGKTSQADLESAQANLPLFRCFNLKSNEQASLQSDLPADAIEGDGWTCSTPQISLTFSSIGYSFGSRLQRALQIPIGIIDTARGGASIESLVPQHKFKDHPLAAAYKSYQDSVIAEFDAEAFAEKKWKNQLAQAKSKGLPKDKWPTNGGAKSLRSWDRPDQSPAHNGSCYNGMFGVFKGLNIKGVLFHQGFNNSLRTSCRPKLYRALMKVMVEGWREDFNDPALPVGVIGFCAGGVSQTRENFEAWSISSGAYIREAQRLGLADIEDAKNTAFLPAHDIQIPGLHPVKKIDHAIRATRWALNRVYGKKINWDSATLVSVEPQGERIVLTFDKPVMPDDMSTTIEGFSIAGKDGKFYLAHAKWPMKKDHGIHNTAKKSFENKKIELWSPLVAEPIAVRYAWATSPMGNLKVNGKPWLPLHSFRTDNWDWPESDDYSKILMDRLTMKKAMKEAAERLEFRRHEEATRAVEIIDELETLGRSVSK